MSRILAALTTTVAIAWAQAAQITAVNGSTPRTGTFVVTK